MAMVYPELRPSQNSRPLGGGEEYWGMVSYEFEMTPEHGGSAEGYPEGFAWELVETEQVDSDTKPEFTPHCILVLKVFDFCFKRILNTECFPFPEAQLGDTPTCRIVGGLGGITCRVAARVPIPNMPNFFRVTLVKEFEVEVTLRGQTRTFSVSKTETIRLFAPVGTVIQCEITRALCEPLPVQETGMVCLVFKICQLVEVKAPVKLEVKARPCMPGPCPQEQPVQPGFICPPEPLPQQPGFPDC